MPPAAAHRPPTGTAAAATTASGSGAVPRSQCDADRLPLVYSPEQCASMLTEAIRDKDVARALRVVRARIATPAVLDRALYRSARRGLSDLVVPLIQAGASACVQVRFRAWPVCRSRVVFLLCHAVVDLWTV